MPVALPPGPTFTVGVQTNARSAPTDTGVAHLAILTDRAAATPAELLSINDFPGSRQPWSVSWDWVDSFFRRGGNRILAQAVTGSAAAAATLAVPGTSGTAFTVSLRDKGEWGNGTTGGFTGQIIAGTANPAARVLIISRGGVEIDRTPEFTTTQTAVEYLNSASSLFFRTYGFATVGAGSGVPPVAAAANFAGGTIDRANITTASVILALQKLDGKNGPGQEACPDFTSDDAHDALKASAISHNRFAVWDPPYTKVKSVLAASASHMFAATGSDYGVSIGPWTDLPPVAAGGQNRSVPPSSLFCAACAVTDATDGDGPAQAPFGLKGIDRYGLGPIVEFSRETINGINDAGDLNALGMNLIIVDDGIPQIYGLRTGADPNGPNQQNSQIGVARLRMQLCAEGVALAKPYVGRKLNAASIEGLEHDLDSLMLAHYEAGDLFGDLDDDRPATAYRIDVATPNTPANLNAGRLGAIVYYRPVKGGEFVSLAFNAVAITDNVA